VSAAGKPVEIRVRVTARARTDRVAFGGDGMLHVAVTAPPVDGAANRAVCRLIAERVGVPKSRVQVVRGEAARVKTVRVEGAPADFLARLERS
jgi:uncharacterized protein (TIGR00251 family)